MRENQYRECLDRLTSSGFVRVTGERLTATFSRVFKNEITAIRAYFTPCNKFTRILIEPVANLLYPTPSPPHRRFKPPSPQQKAHLCRYLELIRYGRCLLLRLYDCSIIIDGGSGRAEMESGTLWSSTRQTTWRFDISHTDHRWICQIRGKVFGGKQNA